MKETTRSSEISGKFYQTTPCGEGKGKDKVTLETGREGP
jgi:hypothetical protein